MQRQPGSEAIHSPMITIKSTNRRLISGMSNATIHHREPFVAGTKARENETIHNIMATGTGIRRTKAAPGTDGGSKASKSDRDMTRLVIPNPFVIRTDARLI